MKRTGIRLTEFFLLVLCVLPATSVSAALVGVSMNDFAFSPRTITVNVGDTVVWTNAGGSIHTSTSGSNCIPDNRWNSGTVNPGGAFSVTFNQAGTFPYFSTPHCSTGMTGTVVVNSFGGLDFIGTPVGGATPLSVDFISFLQGTVAATAYFWNFGDGTTSTQQNPSHIYVDTGAYDVTLSVTLVDGTSISRSKRNYITVDSANGVDFSAVSTSGTAPFNVSFIPSVTGAVTAYTWNFGDGLLGIQSLPTHTYGSLGTFNVSLTVTFVDGTTLTTTKNNYISVSRAGPQSVVGHDFFAVDARETPMTGDFNGDGRTDVITFTRNNPNAFGDVYVSLSNGNGFGTAAKWNDWFAIDRDQVVVVGDFNGDHIDDIATWLKTATRQVYVAASFGSGMSASTLWLNGVGTGSNDVLRAADVNADGMDDLVLFARDEGIVYVALSNGSGFDTARVWHDFFAVSSFERPEVGDVNGDGMADIITFATNSPTAFGDVYVALSTGSGFGDGQTSDKWNDFFSVDPAQIIRIADLNGDGMADFFTFLPAPNAGQVYVVYSRGSFMSENYLWAQNFQSGMGADLPFAGDVNGDGMADLISFRQSEGRAYIALTP